MFKQTAQNNSTDHIEGSFDELMSNLLVLVTHHSLTQCEDSLSPIVERLAKLLSHSELEHYPEQMRVLVKMRQLWETKLFYLACSQIRH